MITTLAIPIPVVVPMRKFRILMITSEAIRIPEATSDREIFHLVRASTALVKAQGAIPIPEAVPVTKTSVDDQVIVRSMLTTVIRTQANQPQPMPVPASCVENLIHPINSAIVLTYPVPAAAPSNAAAQSRSRKGKENPEEGIVVSSRIRETDQRRPAAGDPK